MEKTKNYGGKMKSNLILEYIKGILYYQGFVSCMALSRLVQNVSHDGFTRMLKDNWCGQILLHHIIVNFFAKLFVPKGGYLIIDDTVIIKEYSKSISEAFFVYSSTHKRSKFGVSMVLLVWTDGNIKIPLGYKIWKKNEKSKYDLGAELLSYARNILKLKPKYVVFDSWYGSDKILKLIRNYGWKFVCRVKRNRVFQKIQVQKYRVNNPQWTEVGNLRKSIKVCMTKYRRKYHMTNDLSLTSEGIRAIYKVRQTIENVFALLKSHLNLENCQVGYDRFSKKKAKNTNRCQGPQNHHVALCLAAYLIIEIERIRNNKTWDRFREIVFSHRDHILLPSLSIIKEVA